MTADPIRAERDRMRAVTFAAALRRIADHIVDGTLPAPSTSTSLAWYPRGTEDEQREQAATIARTLGGEWRAETSPGSSYLRAVSSLTPGTEYDGALVVSVAVDHERPAVPVEPARAFAAELAAAVADDRQARIAAVGGPITRDAALEALGLAEDGSSAGCSCGARFALDDLDDHLAVCPLPDPTDAEGDQ